MFATNFASNLLLATTPILSAMGAEGCFGALAAAGKWERDPDRLPPAQTPQIPLQLLRFAEDSRPLLLAASFPSRTVRLPWEGDKLAHRYMNASLRERGKNLQKRIATFLENNPHLPEADQRQLERALQLLKEGKFSQEDLKCWENMMSNLLRSPRKPGGKTAASDHLAERKGRLMDRVRLCLDRLLPLEATVSGIGAEPAKALRRQAHELQRRIEQATQPSKLPPIQRAIIDLETEVAGLKGS